MRMKVFVRFIQVVKATERADVLSEIVSPPRRNRTFRTGNAHNQLLGDFFGENCANFPTR